MKSAIEQLVDHGVTPSEVVWVMLSQGKITVEQAIKFYNGEATVEDLAKQIKK